MAFFELIRGQSPQSIRADRSEPLTDPSRWPIRAAGRSEPLADPSREKKKLKISIFETNEHFEVFKCDLKSIPGVPGANHLNH